MAAKGDVGCGVAVIIEHEGRVLLGRRLGSHMAGFWCFPGGHIDHGESWAEAAARETMEETGLVLLEAHPIGIANTVMPTDGLQYTTIYMRGSVESLEGLRHEPLKNEGWHLVPIGALPGPHMTPPADLLQMGLTPTDMTGHDRSVRRDFVLIGLAPTA